MNDEKRNALDNKDLGAILDDLEALTLFDAGAMLETIIPRNSAPLIFDILTKATRIAAFAVFNERKATLYILRRLLARVEALEGNHERN